MLSLSLRGLECLDLVVAGEGLELWPPQQLESCEACSLAKPLWRLAARQLIIWSAQCLRMPENRQGKSRRRKPAKRIGPILAR